MNNREIIAILIAFIIFAILIFTTPFIEDEYSSLIWIVFFTAIFLIAIIWTIAKLLKMPRHEIIENYKKQPMIVKILSVAIVISIVYYAFTLKHIEIAIILLGILTLFEIFKK